MNRECAHRHGADPDRNEGGLAQDDQEPASCRVRPTGRSPPAASSGPVTAAAPVKVRKSRRLYRNRTAVTTRLEPLARTATRPISIAPALVELLRAHATVRPGREPTLPDVAGAPRTARCSRWVLRLRRCRRV
jgi:hypothetical protein